MNQANQQSVELEQNKYEPYKTYVNVHKVNDDNRRQKWFEGLVTQVTNRGVFVNAMNDAPHSESMDVLCGQFVPFRMFNPGVDIQVVKRSN